MDNFIVIYKILNTLEKAMDYEEFDIKVISAEALGISENRWVLIMEMLVDNGYISGVQISNYLNRKMVVPINIRITLKGLEYLNDNTFMKRVTRTLTGVKEIKGIVD